MDGLPDNAKSLVTAAKKLVQQVQSHLEGLDGVDFDGQRLVDGPIQFYNNDTKCGNTLIDQDAPYCQIDFGLAGTMAKNNFGRAALQFSEDDAHEGLRLCETPKGQDILTKAAVACADGGIDRSAAFGARCTVS